MRPTRDAGYLSGNRRGCLNGTRRDILLQIEEWLVDNGDQRIFWLNGLAGTGKSAIAQTFAERSFSDGKLGASFFCSRDFEDRSNLRAIFPALAFQLAHRYPQFREELLELLHVNPDVGQESLRSQFEKLVVRPFRATGISTLIIIDALDECKDEGPTSALFSVLSRYVDEIPEVKFFITGCPEPLIREGFQLKSLRSIIDVLELHNIKRSSIDEDIKLYLLTHLTVIREARSNCEFPEEWPSSHDIDILCNKAGGIFTYASGVIKFVASNHHSPTERLDFILRPQETTHEGGIDLLYTQILQLGSQGADPGEEEPQLGSAPPTSRRQKSDGEQSGWSTQFGLSSRLCLNATGGTASRIPPVSEDQLPDIGTRAEPSSYIIDPIAVSENKQNLESTLPEGLKSVTGELSAVLEHYEVRYAYFTKPWRPLTFGPANDCEPQITFGPASDCEPRITFGPVNDCEPRINKTVKKPG